MSKTLQTIVAAALLGSTTLASAQTAAERFADQFRVWQSYSSSSSSRWQLGSPANAPKQPPFAEAQSLPAYSPASHRGPSFGQAHPQGLPFEYYQAISAHSDVFKYAPDAGQPAFATALGGRVLAAEAPAKPVAQVATSDATR